MSAVGDGKVPHNRRLHLGVVFPGDGRSADVHVFFARERGKVVLDAACTAAGISLDKGRIVGVARACESIHS